MNAMQAEWRSVAVAQNFTQKINPFLEAHWEEILQEAERRCASDPKKPQSSRDNARKLRELAQGIFITRLESLKGGWLHFAEMEYALDLFSTQCETFQALNLMRAVGGPEEEAAPIQREAAIEG